MIKLLRVDDRLIHGQVAVSWTSFIGADTLLVANEKATVDKVMQMAFNMAKPPQVILSIKSVEGAIAVINNPKHIERKIFIVTATVEDALKICEKCDEVKEICLGGIRKAEGKKMIERQVYLNSEEIEKIKEMKSLNKEIYLQAVPTEKKLSYDEIIKEFNK